ncbi:MULTISPECIES: MazG family protein [unclassified Leifsonia]|uniref:MazG family protein n=1 Tax=unclassified Leifsonia TaxID=2663824 RepID=UPI0006FB7F69|nr:MULTISPECIES: MazG family protein [unclassified Leifsonia]KQX07478.1 nucleoside triphosphate hydrolase [Leifsonia sp. Root1293]KRA11760.1 nucleoside triphosphate hydrolase [Leifsonia sp. Root60]
MTSELDGLIATVALLRAPGGCPWDADQTHESLVRYLVEESHELIDAIEAGDRAEMIEELGDVLYQVLFHADIAANTAGEDFDIQDVAAHMNAKMIGRHPHVFGDREASTADDVVAFWDELKAEEKPHRTSVLDGVPQGMPALALADKTLGKAAKVGVDRTDASIAATAGIDDEAALGAHLLALVANARAKDLDPERALRAAIRSLGDDVRAAEAAATDAEAAPAADAAEAR